MPSLWKKHKWEKVLCEYYDQTSTTIESVVKQGNNSYACNTIDIIVFMYNIRKLWWLMFSFAKENLQNPTNIIYAKVYS